MTILTLICFIRDVSYQFPFTHNHFSCWVAPNRVFLSSWACNWTLDVLFWVHHLASMNLLQIFVSPHSWFCISVLPLDQTSSKRNCLNHHHPLQCKALPFFNDDQLKGFIFPSFTVYFFHVQIAWKIIEIAMPATILDTSLKLWFLVLHKSNTKNHNLRLTLEEICGIKR